MSRALLMGNPNVGKSVVFSRLTGANVVASNYSGTTIDFTKGLMRVGDKKYDLIDVPGTYSLQPSCRAEEVARKMLDEGGDVVINVVDSTNLERNLYLTFELLERDIPVVVALNLWDEAQHLGIDIDVKKLEKGLGVPVIPVVALTGEGIKDLVQNIKDAKANTKNKMSSEERWAEIGKLVMDVQKIEHRHHTLRDTITEATIKPVTGVPIAFVVMFLTFWLIRYIGEWLIGNVTEPFFEEFYMPLAVYISNFLGPGILHSILIGKLIGGEIEFMESMGLLTTGIFVPFGAVLPYIIAFYFGLSLLEDSGYLPRLATLVDNVFHKLGIHGYGIISVFLGMGCNVPGALSTRTMETRKQRFISTTLLAISVPCMAQIAMIFGILGIHGMSYIYMVFGTLAVVYVVAGVILNKLTSGESPEIFLEIPPYRRPSVETILKKTFMRVRWFVKEAIPWLFVGIVIINFLYALGVLQFVGDLTAPLIVGLFGLPKEAVAALVVGFLRKDLAIGMLLGLGMGPLQLVIAATILTIYFPCAATFATIFKELGVKDLLKSVGVMLVTVLIVGTLMRLILLR
ncbi:MAG: FeoB small GTPase domain-containing protein [Archaeoglobaceae archaeon]